MTDVSLIWYTLDDQSLLCSRTQLREWAEELQLPPGPLTRRSPSTTFITACSQTELTYGDPTAPRTVRGRQGGRRDDWVAFDAVRDDGYRLGQLKLFMPRRTAVGVIHDSYKVKSQARPALDLLDNLAAREWLELAEADFHRRQNEVPWYQLRRIARGLLLEAAVPVRRRSSTYFCYAEELGLVQRTATFLRLAAPEADVVVLPVHPGANVQGLVVSADEWVLSKVEDLVGSIERWVTRTDAQRPSLKSQVIRWRASAADLYVELTHHHQKLKDPLPRARAGLLMAEEMIRAIDPLAHLQTVIDR